MPNITVKVTGGTEKENLSAITVGEKRWGQNGIPWGTSQAVPVGNATVSAYYSGQRSAAGTVNIEDTDSTLEITADGAGHTAWQLS